jgi:hypothetical protein
MNTLLKLLLPNINKKIYIQEYILLVLKILIILVIIIYLIVDLFNLFFMNNFLIYLYIQMKKHSGWK